MIFGRSKKGSGRKSALRGALTILLEKDGKVLFEFSSSSLDKPIVIGRGRECDWSVAGVDPSMSGRHAELFVKHGTLRIRDLGSRNGLYFHGQRIQERRLVAGDEILLGACSLSVERAKTSSSDGEVHRYNRLEQLNGPDAGRVVNLVGPADVVIGSDPGCSIICADTLVSHRHAVIAFKQDGSCWVSDLGSRNGSAVNGVPLKKERMLRDGDVLKIAYLEFRFFDKNVVHAHAHIGRTIAIAGATLAVALTGYFIWSSATPSAKTYVAQAQAAAARRDFDAAFAFLDQASVARYADTYSKIIREQRERTVGWTNAISSWNTITKSLASRQWRNAKDLFPALADWEGAFGWNTEDAVEARREAVCVKGLLDAFLDGRMQLQTEEWDESLPDRFRESTRNLETTRAAALDTVATNGYCANLLYAAGDVLREFQDIVADFDFIATELGELNSRSAGPGEHHAGKILAKLEARKAAYDERGEKRKRQKEAGNLLYLRFSRIPGERFGKAGEVMDAFRFAEQEMDENMEKIARGDYGGVTRELPLPSVNSCGELGLGRYRSSLEEVNGLICGKILTGIRTQMEMLDDHGFAPGKVNETFKLLTGASTADEILRFVPDGTRRGNLRGPSCRYDEVVGIDAFFKFLNELDRQREVSTDSVSACIEKYYSRFQPKRWRTLLGRVRDECDALAQFESTIGEPTGLTRKIKDLALPDGANKVAAYAAIVRRKTEEFEDWRDDFCEMCRENGTSLRARVLGLGVDLLLRNPERPSATTAGRLREAWASLRKSVPVDENGTEAEWRAIMKTDIPGTPGFNEAWGNMLGGVWQEEGGVE